MKTLHRLPILALVVLALTGCGAAHSAAVREASTERAPVLRVVNDGSIAVRVYDGPRLVATVQPGARQLTLLEPGMRTRALVIRGYNYERQTLPTQFNQNARWELVVNLDGAVDLNLRPGS